jgi:hypothetical protein
MIEPTIDDGRDCADPAEGPPIKWVSIEEQHASLPTRHAFDLRTPVAITGATPRSVPSDLVERMLHGLAVRELGPPHRARPPRTAVPTELPTNRNANRARRGTYVQCARWHVQPPRIGLRETSQSCIESPLHGPACLGLWSPRYIIAQYCQGIYGALLQPQVPSQA